MSMLFSDLPTMPAPPRLVAQPRPRPSRAKAQRSMMSLGIIITDPDEYRAQLACKCRKCLSCGNDFDSTGPWNRICLGCKRLEAWTSSEEFTVSASFVDANR